MRALHRSALLYPSKAPLTSCSLLTSSLPPPSSLSSSSVCSILQVIWRKYIVYFQALDFSVAIRPKKRNLAMLLVTLEGHNFHFSGSFGLSLKQLNVKPRWAAKMPSNTRLNPKKCDQCDYATTFATTLKRHIRTHGGQKLNKCDLCGHLFHQTGNLKRHMLIHNGEKPHKCRHCNYSCSETGDLKKHMRTHSDEKPYKW